MSQTNEPPDVLYRNFDYLRLFLAVEVVAGHFWAGMLRPGELWMPVPPVAAFVGLSGFLIPQSLERSRDLWHFGWKRLIRTVPALIALLVAITIVFGISSAVGALEQYLTAGYHGEFGGVTLPLWSLIVEDGLYMCMALLFALRVHRQSWLAATILAALILGGSLVRDQTIQYRLVSTSIAFFTGNLICIFREYLRRTSWVWPALGLAASLAGQLAFAGRLGFPFLVACVIVLAMTVPQGRWKIPDISYGMYIWHGPIMLALLGPAGMGRDGGWLLASGAAILTASLLSWYVLEKRALQLKNWPFQAGTRDSLPT